MNVLERAGYRVDVPRRWLCCGRPLYDFGMLDLAAHHLRRVLDALEPEVESGARVVGLEPSCVAVFRDELPDLLARDRRADRVARAVRTLSELLEEDEVPLPRAPRAAVVQPHCHQHAVMGFGAERRVLERLGVDATVLDRGCCGMAGSFGFEAGERHRISRAVGELGVLPAIRAAPDDAVLVADGFSCREQIAQGTGRRALHLAEILDRSAAARAPAPQRPPIPPPRRTARVVAVAALGALGALAAAALVSARSRRRR